MKIVNIIGGLGNQMLEFAFALSLKKHHPDEDIFIDLSHFKGYTLHNGYELETVFKCNLPVADKRHINKVSRYIPNYKLSRIARRFLPKRRTEIIELPSLAGNYQENALSYLGDAYYEGYWQCPRYYEGAEDIIRKAFEFPEIDDDDNKKMAKLIKNTESVCIHIRRGDYVGHPKYEGICNENYYYNSLDYVINELEDPVLFVFSNDMAYCKTILKKYEKHIMVYYVDHNKGAYSFRDMQLMTMSKAIIIANSTFSWWGAWLNTRNGHITICPERWKNGVNTPDVYPSNWIKKK